MMMGYCLALCIYQIGSLVNGNGFTFGTLVAFLLIAAALYFIFRPNPYKNVKSQKVNAVEAHS